MNKITGFRFLSFDNYGYPATKLPHTTKVEIVINREEIVTAEYKINPTIEEFCKITREFLKRIEDGSVNQRRG